MNTGKIFGTWKGRNVLFVGDSLTAKRVYPEVVKDILGIEPFYHCKPGASLKSIVDGDNGIGGEYNNETDTNGVLRPLLPQDVAGMDLIVVYAGYNSRSLAIGKVGDLYKVDGTGEDTVAGHMQHVINRIYENLYAADNMTCRLLIVTVDCSGKYPWVDADGYTEADSGMGNSFEAMANMQKQVAAYNAIPCCDLFHTSGINRHTWAWFGAISNADNPDYSPYRLDRNGKPINNERIRYMKGESYYQIRDGKVVLEKYESAVPYPYNGDQLHKSHADYYRIGEVIAGAIIAAYGN